MTADDFKALALALREAGAVKVRAGELEVIWPGPFMPSQQAQGGFIRSRANGHQNGANGRQEPAPSSPEEARLRAYRRELEGED